MPDKIPHDKYFEGVLQLRNPTDELIRFVFNLVDSRKNVAITKEVKHKDGVDYYFTSQKYLQIVGKRLKSSFPGEYKLSSSLHTRDSQHNKDLYRINILFRYYKVKKGQIITYNGEKYKVIRSGDKLTAKNIKTGKNEFLDINKIKGI